MIPFVQLRAWKALADRANAPTPVPSGYQAAAEEGARRMIRTQLVRDALPALFAEIELLGAVVEWTPLIARSSGNHEGLRDSLDAAGIPWRRQCVCGEFIHAPDPRCEDEDLCKECADELAGAGDQP